MLGSIIEIDSKTASDFLLPKHYSGRVPTISVAYGWYDCQTYTNEHLKAVVTFGKPASPTVCSGVCGEQWSDNVYELNRLCRTDDWDQPLSQLVGGALRRLRLKNWIIVSYSDTSMHHNGYIYQATNFMYTGETKERLDRYCGDNKHSRHYQDAPEEYKDLRVVRSAKHRYVYFCTMSKTLKKQWMQDLRWQIQPYPKGQNENYTLGEVHKQKIVKM